MTKQEVIIIVGPTASGKTEAGMMIAEQLGGEIISGDSMQAYQGLDIGTAKASPAERKAVPHHGIDIKTIHEAYTAADFKDRAAGWIEDISRRGKVPVIVGGTGLYIRALTRNFDFQQSESDPEYRAELERQLAEHGKERLHEQLRLQDSAAAERIHPNNARRVIRALEILKQQGGRTKAFTEQEEAESPYTVRMIGLDIKRDVLYKRINDRVDQMAAAGLIEEAQWLLENAGPDVQAAQAIGYKELFPYLRQESTLEQALDTLKQHSRNYAKRQLTWFRNKEDVEWMNMTDTSTAAKQAKLLSYLEGIRQPLSKGIQAGRKQRGDPDNETC
ncbi:tRNA (adenosine(37)-N6)-dimethylallyltransferase MiaA [Sinobaca sp. H24]|uniref:tRNA (adenosine(37)-N6)-dimethylallyltransferase MiaA n=1 Tax=Sinobaca sp. H24 TaxID=2923376 RepID=UPI002079B5AD|nr:tRNA (adenosine(37)-N6)-dimethylallyltransferase MiaA [Sinobaca sp. H24]